MGTFVALNWVFSPLVLASWAVVVVRHFLSAHVRRLVVQFMDLSLNPALPVSSVLSCPLSVGPDIPLSRFFSGHDVDLMT